MSMFWILSGLIPYIMLIAVLFKHTNIYKDNTFRDLIIFERVFKSTITIFGSFLAAIGGPISAVMILAIGSLYMAITKFNEPS